MERNVVILCSANMCRSPMAAGYLQKRLNELGRDEVYLQSAALYYDGGMRATREACSTAELNQFSLENHRSRFLDDEMFGWADEILVMTLGHKQDLQQRFPDRASEKVFLLGSFEPGMEDKPDREVEIMDPYGSGNATYETVFEQIRRSVDGWLKARKLM